MGPTGSLSWTEVFKKRKGNFSVLCAWSLKGLEWGEERGAEKGTE